MTHGIEQRGEAMVVNTKGEGKRVESNEKNVENRRGVKGERYFRVGLGQSGAPGPSQRRTLMRYES